MDTKQIARTIIEQIGQRTLFAIGAKCLVAMPAAAESSRGYKVAGISACTGIFDGDGGLLFKASLFGKKQCTIVVTLTPADTYRVTLARPRGEVVASFDDVYCDSLATTVELMAERFFANQAIET